MKKSVLYALCICITAIVPGQKPVSMDPAIQETYRIQYFRPAEHEHFAGDPIPFFSNGEFHVFWLLDTGHHALSLGLHQWAHCSSPDLVHWKHYPLALPITWDHEKTIGTGSCYFLNDTMYAFYTTRSLDSEGRSWEYISLAKSRDGINFIKQSKKPYLVSPVGYNPHDFRDPHIFYNDKTKSYILLVTASKKEFTYKQQEGRQVHYVSTDMHNWTFKGDFYIPGDGVGFAIPECPTLFEWNGWYYLSYKVSGGTYYRMSRSPYGPWTAPAGDNIGNDFALVFKIASFTGNRRIAVGMVPSRAGNKDEGSWSYAGNLVFRELFQNPDGTLYSGFVKEMMPETKSSREAGSAAILSMNGFDARSFENIPVNARITFEIVPDGRYEQAGVMLRFSEKGNYELRFMPDKKQVALGNQVISGVPGMEKPFKVDIVMKDDIIDVCIAGKRCILNKCPELKGTSLVCFARNGNVIFNHIIIYN